MQMVQFDLPAEKKKTNKKTKLRGQAVPSANRKSLTLPPNYHPFQLQVRRPWFLRPATAMRVAATLALSYAAGAAAFMGVGATVTLTACPPIAHAGRRLVRTLARCSPARVAARGQEVPSELEWRPCRAGQVLLA